jgi:LPXTG-motif cell wall-anchored protein
MPARRTLRSSLFVIALTAIGLVVTATPPAGAAVKDVGLFGTQDPTFDGVYRQSLALLALQSAGATPDAAAKDWLTKQQCADGTFTSYRPSTTTPCAANAKDSNATGLVVQAQAALGLSTTTSIAGLRTFQDTDGGFFSNKLFSATPGSDANSTGIALSALTAAGIDPSTVTGGGKSGADFLQTDQVGCSGALADRGAYDFQVESPLAPNDYASAQAVLGAVGKALPVAQHTGNNTQPAMTCPPGGPLTAAESAADSAGYLARRLQANAGLIPAAFGTGSDYTSTANAALSLVAAGVGADQVTAALNALAAHVDGYVRDTNGDDRPAALATLILAANAGGMNPRSFGGTNLVTRLAATERQAPAPPKQPTATPTPSASPATQVLGNRAVVDGPSLPATGAHDVALLALIGATVLASGAGLIVAGRRR